MSTLKLVVDEGGGASLRVDEKFVGFIQSLSFNTSVVVGVPQMVVIFPEVMGNPTERMIQESIDMLKPFYWIQVVRQEKKLPE